MANGKIKPNKYTHAHRILFGKMDVVENVLETMRNAYAYPQ